MEEKKSIFHNPFVAGLVGGLLVAVVGAVALSAGWIKAEESEKTVVRETPLATPSLGDKKINNGEGLTVQQIYRERGPGVVFVRAEDVSGSESGPFGFPFPERRGQTATGAGFVIDDEGHIITNAHVVQGARSITVEFGDKEKSASAKLVGEDASSDVALLKVGVDKSKLKPLPLGDSSKIRVGDPVVAIGNPFGLDRTVTTGIVSALQREIRAPNGFTINDVIQTDASINPGNSGGPLIDADGKVIGINSQIATAGGGGSVGVGFAVPIDTVNKELGDLKSKGKVERAYMGITGIGIDKDLTGSLNLPTDEGVLVQDAVKGGPAAKAGIKGGNTPVTVKGIELMLGGDVIIEMDGQKITSMSELVERIDSKKPGNDAKITYYRGKDKKTVTVKLGERPRKLDNE